MGEVLFDRLIPQPRSISRGEGSFLLPEGGGFCVEGNAEEIGPAIDALQKMLGPGWSLVAAADVTAIMRFRITSRHEGMQSYRIRITSNGVFADAHDHAGLFYAAITLTHLVRVSEGRLPVCQIDDAPDFPVRGFMLDISRDKVPTLPTLFWLVDFLAGLKINQFQLYTEHTFAYRGHEDVWRNASPMTAEDILSLDAYCSERCVDLVPNQNSFGHLERWLTLPRYNVLAELPQGGAPLPWGGVHAKPTSLCPTNPLSLAFLEGLYDDLLPLFSSRLFNAGCDETFDLRGNGRSATFVKQHGEGRVYLDFLKQIRMLVAAHGKTMAFWGDIIIRHPELVPELPRDVVALEWGYEADHPFDGHGTLFAQAGVPFYVCPGTSSWNSLAGRTTNMRENLRSAAVNGLKHGACGYLITDWGDGGHWQPLCVSLCGLMYGAAISWGYGKNRDMDLANGLDTYVAERVGSTLLKLGDVYLRCGALRGNGTELFQILSKPQNRPIQQGVTRSTLLDVLAEVNQSAAAIPETQTVMVQESMQVIRLLQAACHRGLALLDGGIRVKTTRQALAHETDKLMASHADVWRLRNREGGLSDSLARFAVIRREYD